MPGMRYDHRPTAPGRPLAALALGLAAAVAAVSVGPALADVGSAGQALIAAMRGAENCAADEAAFTTMIAATGMPQTEVQDAAELLIAGGQLAMGTDGLSIGLAPALCKAAPEGDAAVMDEALKRLPDAELARLQRLGSPGLRGALALEMKAMGCGVDVADREAALASLVAALGAGEGPGARMAQVSTEPAQAELARMLGAFLDDPGPAYERKGDRLSYKHCTP